MKPPPRDGFKFGTITKSFSLLKPPSREAFTFENTRRRVSLLEGPHNIVQEGYKSLYLLLLLYPSIPECS